MQPKILENLQNEKEYFLFYCNNILKATNAAGIFNDHTQKFLKNQYLAAYPIYGCQFMVGLSAEKVDTN